MKTPHRWILALLAGAILTLAMLYPQARLMYKRGEHWNGNYAVTDVDEPAYAAYLQSLIDGRPRVNDPYTKRDANTSVSSPETLFSIQFVSPYIVAIPSRLAGISAPWAMLLSGALVAFVSGLFVFALIERITGNTLLAFFGCLAVFFAGTLVGGEGAVLDLLDLRMAGPFLPGFRRYVPAVIMPVFFAFIGLLWLLLTDRREKARAFRMSLTVLCFGVLVFSYFYLWTAAASVLLSLMILWLLIRPEHWKTNVRTLLIVSTGCFAWLIPYGLLLFNRSRSTDEVQLLEYVRLPDLTRIPEFIAAIALIILAVGIRTRRIEIREKTTLFIGALALVPFVVFNQQVLTGRSLQPVHYSLFVANYLALLSTILAGWHVGRHLLSWHTLAGKVVTSALASFVIGWGAIETHYSGRLFDSINIQRDMGYLAAKRLQEIGNHGTTVLSFPYWSGDDLATTIPQSVLWAHHQITFGMTMEESKERYYQYLYYQNTSAEDLRSELAGSNIEAVIALFGAARYSARLSFEHEKLTDDEIDSEIGRYSEFIKDFRPKNYQETVLSHVIVLNRRAPDLSNLDRWYERDGGEVLDGHTLYTVRLRDPISH